jgi:hypothetical protein
LNVKIRADNIKTDQKANMTNIMKNKNKRLHLKRPNNYERERKYLKIEARLAIKKLKTI